METKKEYDFLDRPENIRKLWMMLYAVCGLLLVSDLFAGRSSHFGWDGFFGFYSLLGFVSCAILILFSKVVGLLLKVREGYYDE
jgi:hypothetical protein